MPAPPWVPVVNGAPCSVWLDFRNNQYWCNNAIVGLGAILKDVNGTSLVFDNNGLDAGEPLTTGTLPSAQTNVNPTYPPVFGAPTPSDLLNALNSLASAAGYTFVVGWNSLARAADCCPIEVAGPWQNPGTANFASIELLTQAVADPTEYKMSVSVEEKSQAFFYFVTEPTVFGGGGSVNFQFTTVNAGPNFSYSCNGLAAVGPIALPVALDAEAAFQFMYLGAQANAVDGITQTSDNPTRSLEYFALFGNTSLPLANFPNAFLPNPPQPPTPHTPPTIIVKLPGTPPDPYP